MERCLNTSAEQTDPFCKCVLVLTAHLLSSVWKKIKLKTPCEYRKFALHELYTLLESKDLPQSRGTGQGPFVPGGSSRRGIPTPTGWRGTRLARGEPAKSPETIPGILPCRLKCRVSGAERRCCSRERRSGVRNQPAPISQTVPHSASLFQAIQGQIFLFKPSSCKVPSCFPPSGGEKKKKIFEVLSANWSQCPSLRLPSSPGFQGWGRGGPEVGSGSPPGSASSHSHPLTSRPVRSCGASQADEMSPLLTENVRTPAIHESFFFL